VKEKKQTKSGKRVMFGSIRRKQGPNIVTWVCLHLFPLTLAEIDD